MTLAGIAGALGSALPACRATTTTAERIGRAYRTTF
jgi:hypothetical protein